MDTGYFLCSGHHATTALVAAVHGLVSTNSMYIQNVTPDTARSC